MFHCSRVASVAVVIIVAQIILIGPHITSYLQHKKTRENTASETQASLGDVESNNISSSSSSSSSRGNSDDGGTSKVVTNASISSTTGATSSSLALFPPSAPPTARHPPLTAVCVSDTHGLFLDPNLIKVPEGDMLLFPGDVEVGNAAEGRAFSHWLAGLPVRGPKVLTWGNMDTATPGEVAWR
ncbi:hypothetical protein Vafri_3666 [Volvox africanus]|uniref:Calcineurin-like phosphoesterase domain-containing protein n=1 Tax=Volvox africanus TaxID=51714 RepID=A0A8J4EV10_9CHLO|nr:hypothetical protein Vafri_3666 [Volvox africanus]